MIGVFRNVRRSMATIQLLTAVVLNLAQFWRASGRGQNRSFLVATK